MKRSFVSSLAAAAVLLVLAPSQAVAQDTRLPATDWRQSNREEALAKGKGSSQSFTFELRFGPYTPQIDQKYSSPLPYQSVFRSDGDSPQFYFGMELDYLPLRIPYVGAFGPGVGWGFTRTSAAAKISEGASKGKDSAEDTGLTIMPMHLSAVLRADELMRRTGVPLVPYGKAGFGLGYWRTDNSKGTDTYTTPEGDKVKLIRLEWGFEFALGGMFSLDFLDPRAAARLDEATGVNHAYVFGEWMNNALVGRNSNGLYVGTSTWVLGLAADM